MITGRPPGSTARRGLLGRFGLRSVWLPFLAFLACQVALQAANRSYTSEFARTWDEAAHYVTGLMVREFIVGGDWSSPMGFAEDYYLHYPKVAIGHWPPGFYAAQTAWTLVFPTTRLSLMLFMAFLTALLATTVYRVIEPEFGRVAGVGAGLLLLALPVVQTNSSAVMAEVPLALLALWATLAFGRFLDTGRWRWSLVFAILASLAILLKPNGLALAFVPTAGLLLARRLRLLTKASFWGSAVVVVGLCGPWYWATYRMLEGALFVPFPNFDASMKAVLVYSRHLVGLAGVGIFALSGLGLVAALKLHRQAAGSPGKWAALGGLGIGGVVFHWISPVDFDVRHLTLVAPALVAFAVAGLFWVGHLLPIRRLSAQSSTGLLAAFAISLFFLEAFAVPGRDWRGFGPVAGRLLEEADPERSLFLVSSDSVGEGALVAEIASRQPRPRHVVLRASKVLASSNWMGGEYRLIQDSVEAVDAFLRDKGVDYLIVDRSVPAELRTPDMQLLEEVVRARPGVWDPLDSFPIIRHGVVSGDRIWLFSRSTGSVPSSEIELDLERMLGRRVSSSENTPEKLDE